MPDPSQSLSDSGSVIPEAGDVERERRAAQALRKSAWWKKRRSSGACHYCGNQVPPAELTMDHVVPLSRGGRSTRGNVVPACKRCNVEKKTRLVWE